MRAYHPFRKIHLKLNTKQALKAKDKKVALGAFLDKKQKNDKTHQQNAQTTGVFDRFLSPQLYKICILYHYMYMLVRKLFYIPYKDL